MDGKTILSFLFLLFVLLSCEGDHQKVGNVVRIDYQGAKIEGGEWVQVDSFRFRHIKKRGEAKRTKYPIPSSEVTVDSGLSREKKRDYNPKTFPIYVAKNIQKINKNLPKNKEYLVTDRFLMSYAGELKIVKRDSSMIRINTSKNYDAKVKISNEK